MRTRALPLALLTTVLAATACTGQQQEPAVDPMQEMEEYEQEVGGEDTGQAATAGLGDTVDLGGGLTIAMVDLRREIAEDGWNSTTGEEGALPYVAWSWELTNNTGADMTLGGTTSACHVGDPLAETEQPHLGTSLNPPDALANGQAATWEADCWMGEEETALQYTLDLYTPDSTLLYTVTFAGDVP